ncbi:MAG: 23S rRNA (adenine(2503)-C(2))-methyltransferase RlmN [Acidobacteria bacterium]|nr:23S rRNA (adenine(2503)-C(2))-methyltransferase RlmN [Acidobacteriota bacterium]
MPTEPNPHPAEPRQDLLGLGPERLRATLGELIDRPYRAEQIFHALHVRGVRDFAAMTELDKQLRTRLAERFRIGWPEIASRAPSADGTCKYLLRLHDGATIEAVDIPDGRRRTLCISSQAGCALACSFCVTGFWGAGRNLTAGEIVSQVLAIRADRQVVAPQDSSTEASSQGAGTSYGPLPAEGLRLVFMGMGEPLLNLDSLRQALDILVRTISWRRITVSTAGVVPGIDELAGWEKRPNLAVSLHAPDDRRRSQVMPINRSYPLPELLAALRRYPLERGRKITFEYLLIRGWNDAVADADGVVKLLAGLRAKVNLIPINPDPVLGDSMVPPAVAQVEAFRQRLIQRGMTVTVRRRRGDDVSAACGQLRAFGRDPRGFKGKPGRQQQA